MSKYTGMEMRKAYASTLDELFTTNKNIYALEADLSGSMSTASLKNTMGANYLNLGIMEANMIGVASGINIAGGYCFIHSFGQFLARRAFDQIFVSLAYAGLKGCLVGSDSGVTAEHNGGTHMTFEDMGLMRTIPRIEIYDVCDPTSFSCILKAAPEKNCPVYIRTSRKKVAEDFYKGDEDFSVGAQILRSGKDITIIACGIEVNEAMKAASILENQGISAEVIDCYRIKPLPESIILDSVRKTGKVITCENHNIQNGLGSAVAELLTEKYPIHLERIGIKNRFGQVGSQAYLMKDYGLDAEHIVSVAKSL